MLCSFLIQLAAIGILHEYRTRPGNDHFAFAWEMGKIGQSIATEHGFSSPYGGSTGASAWEPPLYPYVIAAAFKLFGIYSVTSAWVLLSLNCLFSAVTCIPIFLIGRKIFGEKVGLWSAWIWAFLPYEWYWSVHWIWDTTFSPLLLACIILLALELQERSLWKLWTAFGLLWGLIALSNPSLLSFLPFSGLWIWHGRYRRRQKSIGGVVLATLVFCLCITPWLARNYSAFGKFVFIRADFGYQLRLGNSPGADGMWMAYLQPNLNPQELQQFKQLGELAYAVRCKRIAFAWIHSHPGLFLANGLKKCFYYWAGVPKTIDNNFFFDFQDSFLLAWSVLALWGLARAIKKRIAGAWLFLWLVLSYPTIYYVVYAHARYRHPLEPELLILAVFLVSEARVPKNSVRPESSVTPRPSFFP